MRRLFRVLRWLAMVLIIGVGSAVLVAIVGLLWLRTSSGNAWLETTVEEVVTASMDKGSLQIGSASTDVFHALELSEVELLDENGVALLAIHHARADLNLWTLANGPLSVRRLEIVGLDLSLDTGTERLALAELFGPPSDSTEPFSLPIDVDIQSLSVEGVHVEMDEQLRFAGGSLHGSLHAAGPVFVGPELRVCGHLVTPGPLPLCLEGPVTWDGAEAVLSGSVLSGPGAAIAIEGLVGMERIGLALDVGAVDLGALDPIASDVGLAGTLAGRLQLNGTPTDLRMVGAVNGTGDTGGSLSLLNGRFAFGPDGMLWGGLVDARGVDVAQLYPDAGMPIELNGVLTLDGAGLSFPDDMRLGLEYRGDADIDGQFHVRGADVDGEIDNGILTLDRGAFRGIAGPLDARGTIDLVNGPMALSIDGRLDPAELAELGIVGLQSSGRLELTLRGQIKEDPTRYRVGGTLRFAPFLYDAIRFETLDATLNGVVNGSAFDFTVGADATEGQAYSVSIAAMESENLTVRSDASGLSVLGALDTGRLEIDNLGWFADGAVDLDVVVPPEDDVRVAANVRLGAFDLQTFPGSRGTANISMVGDDLRYVVGLWDGDRAMVRSDGRFQMADGILDADQLELAPTPRLSWRGDGPQHLRLVEGGIADADLALRGIHGDVELVGDLSMDGILDGQTSVRAFQLDVLAELFPDSFAGLSGVLDLSGRIQGLASDPVIEAHTNVHGLWIEGATRWLDLTGDLKGTDGHLSFGLDVGAAGDPLARVEGHLPVVLDLAAPGLDPAGGMGLAAVLHPGALERLEYVTVSELGLPEGRVSAVLNAFGSIADPEIVVRGVLETPLGGWEEPARVEWNIDRRDTDLDAYAVVREGASERAVVQGGGSTRMGRFIGAAVRGDPLPDVGDLRLWLDDMAVSLLLTDVPATSLMAAAEVRAPVTGDLSGALSLIGDPIRPKITGDLHWLRGSLGGVGVDRASAIVEPRGEDFGLDLSAAFANGGQVEVHGTLPLAIDLEADSTTWADGVLDLLVDASGIPLALFEVADPGVSEVKGTVGLAGSIRGTLQEPDAQLEGRIDDGSLVYRPLGLELQNIGGEIEAKGRRFSLLRLEADTNPLYPIGLVEESRNSHLSVSGSARLENGGLASMSMRAKLADAWVMGLSDRAFRAEGDVTVSGNWPELAVRGDIGLVNGRMTYDPDSFAGAGALAVDRRLFIRRKGFEKAVKTVAEAAIFESFDVNLDVDLRRNLTVIASYPFLQDLGSLTANVTRANITARVGGKLNVALSGGGGPAIGGEVDVLSGEVQLLRTQFNLAEGRVYFLGGPVEQAQLELNALASVQGTPVDLAIRGTISRPLLSTTSDGYDDSQVLVMLLTGRSPEAVSTDQGQQAANEAGALGLMAASVVASSVLGGTSSGALSIEPDGAVKIGAPWSSSVFAQLVLDAFADNADNRVAFSLDWSLAPRLILELGAGDRYQWSNLSWEIRF